MGQDTEYDQVRSMVGVDMELIIGGVIIVFMIYYRWFRTAVMCLFLLIMSSCIGCLVHDIVVGYGGEW